MLILMFVLTVAALIVTFVMTNLAKKKKNTGSLYNILAAVQGACLGGNFGILGVLLVLGRTLS